MASEWEELERLTKEELIIELVRMKNLYGMLRENMEPDNPLIPYMERLRTTDGDVYIDGQRTTDEWAERIALYGAMHPKDGMFYYCDLMDYGLTNDQAYSVCGKLIAEGRLKLPEGIRLGDDFRWHAGASWTTRPSRSDLATKSNRMTIILRTPGGIGPGA